MSTRKVNGTSKHGYGSLAVPSLFYYWLRSSEAGGKSLSDLYRADWKLLPSRHCRDGLVYLQTVYRKWEQSFRTFETITSSLCLARRLEQNSNKQVITGA